MLRYFFISVDEQAYGNESTVEASNCTARSRRFCKILTATLYD